MNWSIIEIEEGVIFEDGQFLVEALSLEHAIPSYGFRIIEKDTPGTLDAEKLNSGWNPTRANLSEIKIWRND